jgi:hypothetical protein
MMNIADVDLNLLRVFKPCMPKRDGGRALRVSQPTVSTR